MNQTNYTTPKKKLKHLNFEHYYFIQTQYNFYILEKKPKIPKTKFMKLLSSQINTTLSNIYNIIKDGTITILNYDLTTRNEFSAIGAFNKRKNRVSNNSKVIKAKMFIDKVVTEFYDKSNIASIDEIVNDFINRCKNGAINTITVCTKTMYNYINKNMIDIKRIDLPDATKRKKKRDKKPIKRQKGVSIEQRPFAPNERIFSHWEGDLIVGGNTKNNGAILTLIERKTRKQIVMPLKNKTSKQVYMAINKIENIYGTLFPKLFKTITFDNGNEFSRYKDIEFKPNTNTRRTTVYFAHPYSSFERGSNEHGNKLLRYFIKKGVNTNNYSKDFIFESSDKINNKKRKILSYKSANELFQEELSKL